MDNANLYSDLQRSEAAIRESEKSLRLIVDRIPGLVSTMTGRTRESTNPGLYGQDP